MEVYAHQSHETLRGSGSATKYLEGEHEHHQGVKIIEVQREGSDREKAAGKFLMF